MIIDKIENLRTYEKLNPLFPKALSYLEKTDFSKLEPGRHTIEGEDAFALYMEYETKKKEDCLLENHRTYIDIQYMIGGEELIGISSQQEQTPHIPYDASKDIAFYEGNPDFVIKLATKHFAIFFTDDLHMPCIKSESISSVKKVVIKIRAEK
jgi:YhcH/YjgK/YiaL family protein